MLKPDVKVRVTLRGRRLRYAPTNAKHIKIAVAQQFKILQWIDENTTGFFYAGADYIAFENRNEELHFLIGFNRG